MAKGELKGVGWRTTAEQRELPKAERIARNVELGRAERERETVSDLIILLRHVQYSR